MTTDYKKLAIDSVEDATYAEYPSEKAAYVLWTIAYALLAILERLEVMTVQNKKECAWCQQGDKPRMLDKDGVLSELSGESGTLCHSYDDKWWPCENV